MNDLKALIDLTIDSKIKNSMPANVSYATLVSLDPLNFKLDSNPDIDIKEEFLVVPKYRVFTEKDLNKKFVFLSNDGGQTYFYLYQASEPQGSNGEAYTFEGSHIFEDGEIECELHGTCSDGSTTLVTNGKIISYKGKVIRLTEDKHINEGGGR